MNAPESQKWLRILPALVIVAVVGLLYANTLRSPFVFDDIESITGNESIRKLWTTDIFAPHATKGETIGGRPLLNVSLAINYAISGTNVWSYHATNIAIHALAALTLFGLVRRTWERQSPDRPDELNALTLFALSIALIWAAHPLLTGAVSYVIQRAESLCGLFYLLTLYCFARSTNDEPHARRYKVLSVLSCLAAIATKEVAVTIPVIVFLYDRTFIAGSVRAAWHKHRSTHLALMASWLLLVVIMTTLGGRGQSAGFASGMNWQEYAITQCYAIAHYLRLAFWPVGQIFDYGILLMRGLSDVWPQALLLAVLLGATAWALWKKPVLGFLGAWFLVILAPTSSIAPIVTQTIAEHRMYLPLIAIVAGVVGILHHFLKPKIWITLTSILFISLSATTIARNHVYQTEEKLWRDVTEKHPANTRAWTNLGVALQQAGRNDEALVCFQRAVSQNPNHAFAHSNWAVILIAQGKAAEAIPHLRIAAKFEPDNADIRDSLGAALATEGVSKAKVGQLPEAETLLREAVTAQPSNAEAHGNLGNVLLLQERIPEAIREYETVLRLNPNDRSARENLQLAREFLKAPAS